MNGRVEVTSNAIVTAELAPAGHIDAAVSRGTLDERNLAGIELEITNARITTLSDPGEYRASLTLSLMTNRRDLERLRDKISAVLA